MKDILEKYFREAIQTDSALAAAYRKDKLYYVLKIDRATRG